MDLTQQDAPVEEPIDDERREKIARLKKAVTEGTYQVSPEKLAEKLIDHMLDPRN